MYHWRSSKSAITKGHKEIFLWCKYAHYFDYGFGIARIFLCSNCSDYTLKHVPLMVCHYCFFINHIINHNKTFWRNKKVKIYLQMCKNLTFFINLLVPVTSYSPMHTSITIYLIIIHCFCWFICLPHLFFSNMRKRYYFWDWFIRDKTWPLRVTHCLCSKLNIDLNTHCLILIPNACF